MNQLTPRTERALRATQGMFRAASATNGFSQFTRTLELELNAANERVKELEKQAARYEYVRKLSADGFKSLLLKNITTGVHFDTLVDIAIEKGIE